MQTGSPGDYGTCQQVSPGSGVYASAAECTASGCGQAPTPTPPLTPAVEFASRYETQKNLYYIVPLKSGKSVIICMDKSPDIKYLAGPFTTYEEAKRANY